MTASRLPLIDDLRAIVATLVAWHHFAIYSPLGASAGSNLALEWLRDYRSVVQVFFVISGYVMARAMSPRTWQARHVGWFIVRRYCRLGLPYLATLAIALGACAWGRGWLPEYVVGHRPTWGQILAHVAFLQDILGYESLSAGLWFVCIDFQLGLIYVAMLLVRDMTARAVKYPAGEGASVVPVLLAAGLAAASLFFFNLDRRYDVWAIYFFAQFFMGVMVHHGLSGARPRSAFWLYVAMMMAALAMSWRWRLVISLLTGLLLFAAGKSGLMARWPTSRVTAYLGRTSYSLFLVHFSIFVVLSAFWMRMDWISMRNAAALFLASYVASLVVADLFYRTIEAPAVLLSRKFN